MAWVEFVAIVLFLELIFYLLRYKKKKRANFILSQAKAEVNDIAKIALNNPYPQIQVNKDGEIIFINPAAINEFPDIIDKQTNHIILSGIIESLDKDNKHREIFYNNNYFYQTIVRINNTDAGFILYCYKITERKKYEEKLKKAYAMAEDSRVAAEKAKDARGDFLANMSHELRTPMNGIIGLSDTLVSSGLSSEKQHIMEAINKSSKNLLLLLNDILDFSKIEAGELTLEAIPVSLKNIINHVEILYKNLAHQKGLIFKTEIDQSVPKVVLTDPTRLQQILNNLISNAIKFTEQGEVNLKISGKNDNNETFIANISVSDTGIGISKDKQKTIFEKFQQGDTSTARQYGGTGLGLSITRDLIKMMDGKITIDTKEKKGTSFTITVPLKIAQERELKDDNLIINHTISNIDKSLRILSVDDHPVNLLYLKTILNAMGFRSVDDASNGAQAVKLVKDQKYDLILMDCQMPIMDGFETTKQIRKLELKQERNSTAVIFAVTADAMKGAAEKCLNSGMNDYISKPITKEKLCSMLYSYFPNKNLMAIGDLKNDSDSLVSSTIFNWNILNEITDYNETLNEEIIEVFIRNLKDDIASLQKSYDAGNFKQWDEWAHKIYGACANIGAYKLSDACDKAQSNTAKGEDVVLLHQNIVKNYKILLDYITQSNCSAEILSHNNNTSL